MWPYYVTLVMDFVCTLIYCTYLIFPMCVSGPSEKKSRYNICFNGLTQVIGTVKILHFPYITHVIVIYDCLNLLSYMK